MENLRPKNFKMLTKEEKLTIDHILLTMKGLGKMHAVSFAMKDQRPEEFSEFKKYKDLYAKLMLTSLKPLSKSSIDRATAVLENPKHKQIMHRFRETFHQRIERIKDDLHCDEFGVIIHGDCWSNNIMYQQSNDDVSIAFHSSEIELSFQCDREICRLCLLQRKKLESTCFVDFQFTHYSPPVIDLLYNIFSSTDKPFRDQHYDTILRTYYQSLSDHIRKLGSDPDKLYTWEDFQKQLVKYSDYALFFGPFAGGLTVAKAKDVTNLDDFADKIDQGIEADLLGEFDEETQAQYSRIINGILTDLVDYGYVKN